MLKRRRLATTTLLLSILSAASAMFVLNNGLPSRLIQRYVLSYTLKHNTNAGLQNTRYVVTEGARQKHEEWDPAEAGQFVLGLFQKNTTVKKS